MQGTGCTRRAALALLGGGLLAAVATGCGWRLRGAPGGASLEGRALQVRDQAGSPELRRAVRRGIEGAGGREVEDLAAADWVLTLHGHGRSRRKGQVGTDGEVVDYELTYTVTYSVASHEGETLLRRQSLEAQRTFAEPAGGADARRAREEELEAELRAEAVRLMMLRLQTLD
ncbi:MAG: LPS assembly lipoprotein LptE [Halorhodospira sp.]